MSTSLDALCKRDERMSTLWMPVVTMLLAARDCTVVLLVCHVYNHLDRSNLPSKATRSSDTRYMALSAADLQVSSFFPYSNLSLSHSSISRGGINSKVPQTLFLLSVSLFYRGHRPLLPHWTPSQSLRFPLLRPQHLYPPVLPLLLGVQLPVLVSSQM
jgi:hypothetical protein